MTKFEWERQLKKGISGLPKAEQQRVLEYYNELFADKIDAGLREQYIISEFGNPYDVANKILVDYYNGDKENPEVDAYIYADSDEIDSAFDEPSNSEPVRYAEPTRKEKRDDRRVEYRETHKEPETKREKISKSIKSASGLIALICVIAFFVLGACFNMWHPAWLIFLAMPAAISLIQAIIQRNWKIFAYPVFVAFIYLASGFSHGNWHPAWVLFLTIPLYYVLGDFIAKNVNGEDKKRVEERKEQRVETAPRVKQTAAEEKKKEKKNSSGVIATIAKVLLAICLIALAVAVCWFVIGLFVGGIGMIIGGIGCIVAAATGITGTANMVILGVALAIIGLGLICTFGMSMLFKPCFNMCKSFVNTIKRCFNGKEAE